MQQRARGVGRGGGGIDWRGGVGSRGWGERQIGKRGLASKVNSNRGFSLWSKADFGETSVRIIHPERKFLKL